jgi:hypothetical protein
MNQLRVLAIVLLILGAVALSYQGVMTITTREKVLDMEACYPWLSLPPVPCVCSSFLRQYLQVLGGRRTQTVSGVQDRVRRDDERRAAYGDGLPSAV